jgi:dipeptidyl aminopeptidase/acylaminoacyl peptidase
VEGGEDEVESDLPKGTYAYVAQAGQSTYVRENLEDQAETEIKLGASITSKAESFQLSSNSTSYAVNTGSGIFVKTASKEHTLLVEQSSRMRDWLLIPDGTRVYALVGNALWAYDTNTAEGGEVASDFSPPGTDASRLGYSRDGSLFIYSKNAGLLTGAIYEPNSGEVSKVEKEVIRLSRVGEFQRASVSPDGSSIVFFADISGNPTLQLLSLNSYVLRTVYVAESGNRPQAFEWSEDSNNVIVYETGATPLIGNLKVGTLEKEILLQNPGNVSSMTWAPDKKRVAYIAGGKLISLDLENKEPKTLIESVQADSFTGWFQN